MPESVVEKTIFELSSSGRTGYTLPEPDVPLQPLERLIPDANRRLKAAALPEVSEVDVMRHFVRLSVLNHHVDKGFYPLGSCTMKYNPKVNEKTARYPGFVGLHPFQPEETVQGALRLMYELATYLAEIGGMHQVTLQPSAGAQAELAGLFIIRAFHEKNGQPRSKVIIPDSAHGTNPSSVVTAGYQTVQLKSCADGIIDVEELKKALDEQVAAVMVTNPNTLGLFEREILKISQLAHEVGTQMYMDGANLNALLGLVKPGDMGFDVVHFNLHKTFSTPHGGGGPGAGAVGVREHLVDFLPVPVVARKTRQDEDRFYLDYKRPDSIGRLHECFGNFGVFVRAYTYLRLVGALGLKEISENAILNANYLLSRLRPYFDCPYPRHCMHEFVLTGARQKTRGVRTMDIAKRLLDFGVHAPTVYFPLIVPEALMIEPTETESLESIEEFAQIMVQIAREAEKDPELLKSAPHNTPVSRLDEVRAVKDLNLRWS